MNSITNRQPNPSLELEYSEIYIPDKDDLGTGSFTTRVKPRTLVTGKFISSGIVLTPHFQLSVNLNPANGKVPVLLGHADGTPPLSRRIFLLPQTIDQEAPHDFIVNFQNWNIISFIMDTMLLLEGEQIAEKHETAVPQKEPSNMTRLEFFRLFATGIEKLIPNDWFNNPKNKTYPVYQRWAFYQKMISQNGFFKFPEQKTELPLFGQFLLDTEYLKTIFANEYFDQLLEPARVKIAKYLAHPTQFDDIMLEISFAAWHLMENHRVEILEIDKYPDVKVNVPTLMLPIYAECKNVTTDNDNSIKHKINDANGQLKSVSEAHYGIVVLNIAKSIERQRVYTDAYPERVDEIIKLVKQTLRGARNRSVGAAILIWDDFIQHGEPPQKMYVAYRRRFVRIDHSPEEGCLQIPENADLYKGNTSTYWINS
jgi:hypothetical protein